MTMPIAQHRRRTSIEHLLSGPHVPVLSRGVEARCATKGQGRGPGRRGVPESGLYAYQSRPSSERLQSPLVAWGHGPAPVDEQSQREGATKPSRCVGARTRQAWTRRARPHCVANTEKAESKNETPAPQANRRANRKKMPRRRILFDGGASGYFEMVVSFWMVWDCPPGPVTVLSLDQVLVEASQLPVVLVFTDLLRGPVVVELRL